MNTADALRIGLLLPSRELMLDGPPDARRLAVIAADAEHRGYDSVWVDEVAAGLRRQFA